MSIMIATISAVHLNPYFYVIRDPYSGPDIYPIPKKQLNTPDARSLTKNSSSGYLSITASIISGRDGTNINGSTIPCRAYPIPISNKESGNSNRIDGPTNILTRNDKKHAVISTALFSIPLGMNYTRILVGM